MNCSCCKKPKHNLNPAKSALMPGAQLILCEECRQHEPRHIVIIAARSRGADSVKEYIGKRRYHGVEILAEEVLT